MTTLNPNNRDLREEERSALWQDIEQKILQASPALRHQAAANPIMHFFTTPAAKGVLALVVALGLIGGGTAADAAKPGDALFGIDLALEKLELALAASAESKAEVRIKHAEERLEELSVLFAAEADADAEADTNEEGDEDTDEQHEDSRLGLMLAIEHIERAQAQVAANGNAKATAALEAVLARLNARIAELPDESEYEIEVETRENNGARVEFRIAGDDDETGFYTDEEGNVVRVNKRVRVHLPATANAGIKSDTNLEAGIMDEHDEDATEDDGEEMDEEEVDDDEDDTDTDDEEEGDDGLNLNINGNAGVGIGL